MEELRRVESEKARLSLGVRSCSDGHCPDAVLQMGDEFYYVQILGKAKTLWDILRQWNGLSCVRSALEHFGCTLAECYKDSPKQVATFFLERFAEDIARVGQDGSGAWIESRWNEWKWLVEQADGLPEAFRGLLREACDELFKSSAQVCFAWLKECDL